MSFLNFFKKNKLFLIISSIFTTIILSIGLIWGLYLKPKIGIRQLKDIEDEKDNSSSLSVRLLELKNKYDKEKLAEIIFKAFKIKDIKVVKKLLNLKLVPIFEKRTNIFFNKNTGEIIWEEINDLDFLDEELEVKIEHWVTNLKNLEKNIDLELLYQEIQEEYFENDFKKFEVLKIITDSEKNEETMLKLLEIDSEKNPLKLTDFNDITGDIKNLRNIKKLNNLNEILKWVKTVGQNKVKKFKTELRSIWPRIKEIVKFGIDNQEDIEKIKELFKLEEQGLTSDNFINNKADGSFEDELPIFFEKIGNSNTLENYLNWFEQLEIDYPEMLRTKIKNDIDETKKAIISKAHGLSPEKMAEVLGFDNTKNGLKKEFFYFFGTFSNDFDEEISDTEKLKNIIHWISEIENKENKVDIAILKKEILENYTKLKKEIYLDLDDSSKKNKFDKINKLKLKSFNIDGSFVEGYFNDIKDKQVLEGIKKWVTDFSSLELPFTLKKLKEEILDSFNDDIKIKDIVKRVLGLGTIKNKEKFLEIPQLNQSDWCLKTENFVVENDVNIKIKLETLKSIDNVERFEEIKKWILLLKTTKIRMKLLKYEIKEKLTTEIKKILTKAFLQLRDFSSFYKALSLEKIYDNDSNIKNNVEKFKTYYDYLKEEMKGAFEDINDVNTLKNIKKWITTMNESDALLKFNKYILIQEINEWLDENIKEIITLKKDDSGYDKWPNKKNYVLLFNDDGTFKTDYLKIDRIKQELENIKNWLKELLIGQIVELHKTQSKSLVNFWKKFADFESQKENMGLNTKTNKLTKDSFKDDGSFVENYFNDIKKDKVILDHIKKWIESTKNSVEADAEKVKEYFKEKFLSEGIKNIEINNELQIKEKFEGYKIYFAPKLIGDNDKKSLQLDIMISVTGADQKIGTTIITLNTDGTYGFEMKTEPDASYDQQIWAFKYRFKLDFVTNFDKLKKYFVDKGKLTLALTINSNNELLSNKEFDWGFGWSNKYKVKFTDITEKGFNIKSSYDENELIGSAKFKKDDQDIITEITWDITYNRTSTYYDYSTWVNNFKAHFEIK